MRNGAPRARTANSSTRISGAPATPQCLERSLGRERDADLLRVLFSMERHVLTHEVVAVCLQRVMANDKGEPMTTRRMREKSLLVLLCLAGILATGAFAAAAAPAEQHCVVQLDASGQGRSAPMQCYADEASAMSAATGQNVTASDLATAEAVDAFVAKSNATTMASTVISIEYDGQNYSGSTLRYTVSNPNGCLDGSTYTDPDLYAWDNRIESVRSYQGCTTTHYDYYNYGGSAFSCSASCGSLGAMNNKTSSLRWS